MSAASVAPKMSSAAEDIIDIRPPIHIATPFPWLAVSAAGIESRRNWRGRRGSCCAVNVASLLTRSRSNVSRTRGRSCASFSAERPFAWRFHGVVREFIEEVLFVRAMRRTTNEFLRDLAKLSYLQLDPHRDTLTNFLRAL